MHPDAALLLYDFMLGEAQEILARRDLLHTNPNVRLLPGGNRAQLMNPAQMLDEGRKWTALWERTITKPQ